MTTPPEPPEPPSSPPPGAIPPAATWSVPALPPADRVRTAWIDRARSDYLFVNPWLNVFLIIITCGIFGLYLFYQLVRRSRDEGRRERISVS